MRTYLLLVCSLCFLLSTKSLEIKISNKLLYADIISTGSYFQSGGIEENPSRIAFNTEESIKLTPSSNLEGVLTFQVVGGPSVAVGFLSPTYAPTQNQLAISFTNVTPSADLLNSLLQNSSVQTGAWVPVIGTDVAINAYMPSSNYPGAIVLEFYDTKQAPRLGKYYLRLASVDEDIYLRKTPDTTNQIDWDRFDPTEKEYFQWEILNDNSATPIGYNIYSVENPTQKWYGYIYANVNEFSSTDPSTVAAAGNTTDRWQWYITHVQGNLFVFQNLWLLNNNPAGQVLRVNFDQCANWVTSPPIISACTAFNVPKGVTITPTTQANYESSHIELIPVGNSALEASIAYPLYA